MSRPPVLRWTGVVVLVLAAMSLGRVVSEFAATDDFAVDPFIVHGVAGEQVDLGYAEVAVTDVKVAHGTTTPAGAALAAGALLAVDVEFTSTRRQFPYQGVAVVSGDGRRMDIDPRFRCAHHPSPPTRVAWRATFCIDVPPAGLAGSTLVFTRSAYDVDGSGQRRDAIAEIDLGITSEMASDLAETNEIIDVEADGPVGA